MPKKTKGKKSSVRAAATTTNKAASAATETFKFCPMTGDKVWISTVTLSDLKRIEKNGGHVSNHNHPRKKQLIRLPSKQEREKLYREAADALAARELECLDDYGGRSWQVHVRLSEPGGQKPPLFRWFRGRLELACLPHLLEKIPDPPPRRRNHHHHHGGWRNTDDQEEDVNTSNTNTLLEYIPSTALQERAVSSLSELVWSDPEYAIPNVSIRWTSPNLGSSHGSRRAAYEHRDALWQQTLLLDRVLHGRGARGQKLKPFKPTQKEALRVGQIRFVRDGLWVVGQEEAWQEDRMRWFVNEQERLKRTIGSKCENVEEAVVVPDRTKADNNNNSVEKQKGDVQVEKSTAVTKSSAAATATISKEPVVTQPVGEQQPTAATGSETKRRPLSGLQCFLAATREAHRTRKRLELLAAGDTGEEQHASRMTLREAEKELRVEWKKLTNEEQHEWTQRAKEHEAREATAMGPNKTTFTGTQAAVSNGVPADGDVAPASVLPGKEKDSQQSNHSAVSANKLYDTCQADSRNTEVAVSIAATKQNAVDESKPTPPVVQAMFDLSNCDSCNEPSEIAPAATANDKVRSLVSPSPPNPCTGQQDEEDVSGVAAGGAEHVMSVAGRTAPSIPPPPATKKRRKPSECPPRKIQPSSRYRLNPKQIDLCYKAAMEHYDVVMNTVKARALHAELQDGFDLLRERGRGRFDMELPVFDTPEFSFLTDLDKAAWMPIVREILGQDVVLIHKGVFLSMPGAEAQEYHQDGVHLNTKFQRPCHAINVFIPLVDLHSRNGPTEFCLGSHYLGHDGYDRSRLETPRAPAGTPVIFDYRLGHRGLANSSSSCRPIVYCTYAAAADGKEFRDSVNFSRRRYKKIGELVEKPLSREERVKRRKRSIEAREQQQAAEEEYGPSDEKSSNEGDVEIACETDMAAEPSDTKVVKNS